MNYNNVSNFSQEMGRFFGLEKGKLVIISGFSGVGKGTIISNLMKRHEGEYVFSISATTRKPRPGEVDGREYFFVSLDEFEKMIADKKMLEYTRYGENYYGTILSQVDNLISHGKTVILDIEVNGKRQVKSIRDDALTVFVVPPSSEELIGRLNERGTENKDQLLKRLSRAVEEANFVNEYDFVLQNIDIEKATNDLEEFIEKGINISEERDKNIILAKEISEGIKRHIKGGDF